MRKLSGANVGAVIDDVNGVILAVYKSDVGVGVIGFNGYEKVGLDGEIRLGSEGFDLEIVDGVGRDLRFVEGVEIEGEERES